MTHADRYKAHLATQGKTPEEIRAAVKLQRTRFNGAAAMKAKGVTISRVWEEWQLRKSEKEEITEGVEEPMGYEAAVTEWKARKLKVGKSQRYVYHAGADLMKFGKGQEDRLIHEILPSELEKYIDAQKIQKRGKDFGKPWGLSTRRTNMALFSSLWKVAIAKGWAKVNIVDRLEPVGEISRVKLLYPTETMRNLMAATMETPKTRTYLAPMVLGAFGCMRPEEITSNKAKENGLPPERWFGWKDIDLKNGLVNVSVDVAKTGDERTIRLQPMAVEWLKIAKEEGSELPPVDEFRTNRLICDLIGLDDWIRDGLRKSCATHLRVIYRNDYDVVKDLGNSIRVLLKDYAELRTPEAVSKEHWMLTVEMIKEYRKSREWLKVLRDAAEKLAARKAAGVAPIVEATEAAGIKSAPKVKVSAKPPKRSASGNAKV
jgi:hypothetical protein